MNLVTKLLGMARKSMVSLQYEPANVSQNAKVSDVNGMIRAAESGDTRQLFALYRDLTLSGSHVQTELNKRKLSVIAQPHAILPENKEDPEDVKAADAVRQMIADCENWLEGLTHLLDGTVWPVAVVEKLFRPAESTSKNQVQEQGMGSASPQPSQSGGGENALKLQYTLRRFEPVNPTVLCFRQPYGSFQGSAGASPYPNGLVIDPNAWEPDLRFFKTSEQGVIQWNYSDTYAADPMRHMVHRGHLLVGVRDNWGGPMRAIVFWWLLSTLGRDWFGRYMERYGQPFLVGKTDSTSNDAVNFLKDALSLATKIGGIVVDHETELELTEAMSANAADAYEKFLGVCNKEISKVILGQTLSADAQPTGLGSGTSNLQGEVRDDFRAFDQIKLGETLRQQLFKPFLEMNGLRGAAPKIVWGGLSPEESAAIADLLVKLSNASLEPTDEAIPTISEKVGFQLQRKVISMTATGPGGPGKPLALSMFGAMSGLGGSLALPTHPSDRIVEARAKALGDAYRGSMAPIRVIILNSTSREDCLKKLEMLYPDWNPTRLAAEVETALQICAAAGAAAGVVES